MTVAANLSGISHVGTESLTFTIDNTVPVVTVNSGLDYIAQGSTWTDAGATSYGGEAVIAVGNVDTATAGTYMVTYTATDTAGNTGIATRQVRVFTLDLLLLDEWTFEVATPQKSTNNKTIDKWGPTLAANSHTGSVLTYGEYGTTNGAFYGATYLGLSTRPNNITITIDIVDFSFAANGAWRFQFTGPGAGADKMRGEFNIYNDNVSVHIEGNGTSLNGGGFIKQTDYSEFTSLQITYTWDFANNEM